MEFYKTAQGAISGYHEALGAGIADALKTLMETKHLYQKTAVDSSAIRASFLPKVANHIRDEAVQMGHYAIDAAVVGWIPSTNQKEVLGFFSGGANEPKVVFTPPDIKVYCTRECHRLEAFNLVSVFQVVRKDESKKPQQIEELYAFTYRCQSCKSTPDAFVVRRHGGKRELTGRSPMEHVEIPAVIHKDIAKYYSGALLAYQSGQHLPALFMLRTACEQFARKWAAPTARADEAMDRYMASLPEAFKSHFPSLKDIYSQLSADIHGAIGSSELFVQMTEKLVEHFEARRLYKLTEPKAA
ncbi:hypothetical protein [Ramlibacter sp. WS9]|uniref:hypothetical protein n=1 Tax=Ramlibacter sp. WS9 TaxID=1882741 RepID=UPI001143DBA8|nr:hypothetical protein [Ramlibacter sp. WS9]ROZ71478.1 hypothetical protein EEB15_20745 [Ramlibacter sp. WS9]